MMTLHQPTSSAETEIILDIASEDPRLRAVLLKALTDNAYPAESLLDDLRKLRDSIREEIIFNEPIQEDEHETHAGIG